jgi:hypothetical protein
MTPLDARDEADLQAWIDGTMDDAASAVFERRLAADAGLRAATDLDDAVAASLRRTFVVPDLGAIVTAVKDADGGVVDGKGSATPFRPSWRVAAATLIVGFAVGMAIWTEPRDDGPLPPAGMATAEQIEFVACTDDGNALGCSLVEQIGQKLPLMTCKTPSSFTQATQANVGCGLNLRNPEALPLDGRPIDGVPDAMAFTARVDGRPVLLFIVHEQVDRRPELSHASGFRCFRRAIPPVVCYEITTFNEARLLGTIDRP